MSSGRGARGGPAGLCAVWDPGQPAPSGAGQQPDRRRRGRTEGWRPPSEPHRVEAGTIRVAAPDACGRSELPRESLPRLPTSEGALSEEAFRSPLSSWESQLVSLQAAG